MDSFSNKDELRYNNWRNAELLLKSGAKFSLMSDHPNYSPEDHVLYSEAPIAIWIIKTFCNI